MKATAANTVVNEKTAAAGANFFIAARTKPMNPRPNAIVVNAKEASIYALNSPSSSGILLLKRTSSISNKLPVALVVVEIGTPKGDTVTVKFNFILKSPTKKKIIKTMDRTKAHKPLMIAPA